MQVEGARRLECEATAPPDPGQRECVAEQLCSGTSRCHLPICDCHRPQAGPVSVECDWSVDCGHLRRPITTSAPGVTVAAGSGTGAAVSMVAASRLPMAVLVSLKNNIRCHRQRQAGLPRRSPAPQKMLHFPWQPRAVVPCARGDGGCGVAPRSLVHNEAEAYVNGRLRGRNQSCQLITRISGGPARQPQQTGVIVSPCRWPDDWLRHRVDDLAGYMEQLGAW